MSTGSASNFSQREIEEYKKIFKKFDKDGNNKICRAELRNVMQEIGLPVTDDELDKMMKVADTDRSGYVEFEEFLDIIHRSCEYERETQLKDEEIRVVFESFDLDSDGKVTDQELKRAVRQMGLRFTDAQVAEMIREADKSGDGVIDYQEFLSVMKGGFLH